jgi:hypothetical protein
MPLSRPSAHAAVAAIRSCRCRGRSAHAAVAAIRSCRCRGHPLMPRLERSCRFADVAIGAVLPMRRSCFSRLINVVEASREPYSERNGSTGQVALVKAVSLIAAVAADVPVSCLQAGMSDTVRTVAGSATLWRR